MINPSDILQLCRLCLVEDAVNHSIFEESGDLRSIFLKISSCLPVSIHKDDGLPEKICDSCSTKLDSFYQFWNETANAEKQLLQWLRQTTSKKQNQAETSKKMETTEIKQEEAEDTNMDPIDMSSDAQTYILQQQQLPYASVPTDSINTSESDEPLAKRPKRASAVRALEQMESEDEDDPDLAPDNYAKTESDDSDKEEEEDVNNPENPSTSMEEQPGPSGIVKKRVVLDDTPLRRRRKTILQVDIKSEIDDDDTDWLEQPAKNSKKSRRKPRTNVTWTCKKCLEEFSTRKLLQAHKKIHIREESPTTLALKNYKFDESVELYICNFCSAEYQDEDEIKKHISNNHITKFKCQSCMQAFTEPYKFSVHIQKHGGGDFFCPLCSYHTPRMTCIQSHINRMHLQKFIYNCKTCGKGFNDQAIFKEHDNEHLGIKPFTCVVCNKSFVFSKYLFAHQVRYHVVNIEGRLQNNQCGICMRIFAKDSTLEKHMKNRHENYGLPREKKLLCDICGQGFSRNDKLKIHYRIHTGVKPYACSYCPKSFIKKEYLVMHERVHNGERPYSCEYCGKCFNQSAPLRIHVRGHTGEKPYICQICEQGFISRSSLNFHRKNYCTGRQEIL